MTKEEAFDIWAPDSSIWSPWVKAVLFSYLDQRPSIEVPFPQFDLSWAPSAGTTVIVVDIPGVESVSLGVRLATVGYRPIPLFNSVPLPSDSPEVDETGTPVAAVDSVSVLGSLHHGALELSQSKLPANAPPVFLLDANRGGPLKVKSTQFDNRSVSFTTDFPSAKFLLSQGIARAILVTKGALQPQRDLAHILRRWQESGISIFSKRLIIDLPPEAITVDRPPRFRAFFQRAMDAFGLRRNPSGGYGGWMPDAEGHGGGG